MTTTNTQRHPRSRAREVALQLLFQHDLNPGVDREEVARFAGEQLLPETDLVRRAVSLYDAVASDRAAIDERIGKAAENWRIQRMAVIDRNLIRLGAAEFARLDGEPVGPVMSDVIELARAFGSAESPAFVNGVLDRMYREAKKAEVAKAGSVSDGSSPAPTQEPEASATVSPPQEPEASAADSPVQEAETSAAVSSLREPEASATVSSQEPEASATDSPVQEPEASAAAPPAVTDEASPIVNPTPGDEEPSPTLPAPEEKSPPASEEDAP